MTNLNRRSKEGRKKRHAGGKAGADQTHLNRPETASRTREEGGVRQGSWTHDIA
jgi:hypothetical protein